MKQTKKLVLASASPRRSELLEQIGLKFEVIKSVCEEVTEQTTPEGVVFDLSRLKALDVVGLLGDMLGDKVVLAADTVVAVDDVVLGKPSSKEHAITMLQSLQGREHCVYTGVTVCYKNAGELFLETFVDETKVTVYPMSLEEIIDYIELGTCMDKSGAYGIQNEFASFIKKIDGDYNNVVGLPVSRVYQALKKLKF
ncbi:MAG: Maf family protein [Lachnospiraceae bacterium]